MAKKQKTKKQFVKEQKRKEKAKKRVLNRRKVIRKDAKEKKEIERLEWKYREKQTPLRKVNVENRDGVNDVLEDVNYSENVSVEEKDE